MPCLPYSSSIEHKGFPGTVWLKPGTLARVVKDIVSFLKEQGIDEIIIMNGHGGNFILKPTVRELNLTNPGTLVILVDLVDMISDICSEEDLHAGEFETSLLLYLYPELVREEKDDYVPKLPRGYIDYLGFKHITPKGVWGRPSRASASKGKKLFKIIVRRVIEYVRNVEDTYETRRRGRAL